MVRENVANGTLQTNKNCGEQMGRESGNHQRTKNIWVGGGNENRSRPHTVKRRLKKEKSIWEVRPYFWAPIGIRGANKLNVFVSVSLCGQRGLFTQTEKRGGVWGAKKS